MYNASVLAVRGVIYLRGFRTLFLRTMTTSYSVPLPRFYIYTYVHTFLIFLIFLISETTVGLNYSLGLEFYIFFDTQFCPPPPPPFFFFWGGGTLSFTSKRAEFPLCIQFSSEQYSTATVVLCVHV